MRYFLFISRFGYSPLLFFLFYSLKGFLYGMNLEYMRGLVRVLTSFYELLLYV